MGITRLNLDKISIRSLLDLHRLPLEHKRLGFETIELPLNKPSNNKYKFLFSLWKGSYLKVYADPQDHQPGTRNPYPWGFNLPKVCAIQLPWPGVLVSTV
jgi:hypothetical protein